MMAIYAVAVTYNLFSLDRARVALAAEMHAAGVPDTSIDNGWEYNFPVELEYADHINDPLLKTPASGYIPVNPPTNSSCSMTFYDETPHIHPLYSVSFDPNACYGPAPFTPVHYSRWLASQPGTLYVVNALPKR
jgi:hypothetical protein